MVQIDELGAHGQAAERGLREDLVEAMVVLDELSQRPLVEMADNHNIRKHFDKGLVHRANPLMCPKHL